MERAYTVTDEFFDALANEYANVWPKLTKINLGEGGCIEPEDGDGILRLIAKRRAGQVASSTEGPGPGGLREIVLDCDDSPAWLRAETRRLLAM